MTIRGTPPTSRTVDYEIELQRPASARHHSAAAHCRGGLSGVSISLIVRLKEFSLADRVVTAHIPQALAREVDRLASRLDRPRGWLVKEALERYVELERKRHALTLEALADVEAGRVVDHAEVEAWAAKASARKRGSRG